MLLGSFGLQILVVACVLLASFFVIKSGSDGLVAGRCFSWQRYASEPTSCSCLETRFFRWLFILLSCGSGVEGPVRWASASIFRSVSFFCFGAACMEAVCWAGSREPRCLERGRFPLFGSRADGRLATEFKASRSSRSRLGFSFSRWWRGGMERFIFLRFRQGMLPRLSRVKPPRSLPKITPPQPAALLRNRKLSRPG